MQHFALDTLDGVLHEDGFLVVVPCPGATVSLPNMLEALARGRDHFGRSYGLIFDRLGESRMDFPNYPLIDRDTLIAGVALLRPPSPDGKVALLESRFFGDKVCQVFDDIEQAKSWLRGLAARSGTSST